MSPLPPGFRRAKALRHPSPLRGALQSVNKKPRSSKLDAVFCCHVAEEEGFEPPVRCRTTVFKTAAIDHSAIPPVL